MLSDKNLNTLENKVNNELNKIDYRLKNKLSLNFITINYLLNNKRPNISCIAEFQLRLKTSIQGKHTVKYLGIFLDKNLKWCD